MSTTTTNSNDLLKDLETFKEDYYSKNSKNMFFKKSQKADCAQKICEQYDINALLQQTAYFIPTNNEIFFNYPMFKLFANENNYSIIIDYVFDLINASITSYNEYIIHIDLSGFTITAAERYKSLIMLFNAKCVESSNIRYIDYCKKWYIYNPPLVIDMIGNVLSPLLHPDVLKNLTIYPKKESPLALNILFGNV
jgi:hypothetical protein